ncbi:MAG: purple acid phosphatase family protein [Methylobacter sp.]
MKTCTLVVLYALLASNSVFAADEIHWTFTGQTSVTFDWRGTNTENTIRYGTAPGTYGNAVTAVTPIPLPTSSSGPFWEADITGLQENTLYYYSIANGSEHTFRTPPLLGESDFIVYAVGDIGSTNNEAYVNEVNKIIGDAFGNGFPDFALLVGDLTYGDTDGVVDTDQAFNDVMVWSQDTAYMPAWGNHEWDSSTLILDQNNNYEGRFALPHSMTSPGATRAVNSSPGEDWYWFDYGNVRFIAYPEPYSGARADWNTKANALMAAAQADPQITFIVTFGHSPAYSSSTPGNSILKGYLDGLGLLFSKYVLNLSGHHHNYERSAPSQTFGVTHIVVGMGGASPDKFDTPQPSWSVYRAIQPAALKLHFTKTAIEGELICAPASVACIDSGAVKDSFIIGNSNSSSIQP